MAKDYRPVDRDQAFLLPPSMTDWLPDDHVVWFVIEAVKRLNTTAFHAKAKLGGVGRRGYDPVMLLTLFVYAMAHGVRSSRQMERLCGTDVAFRIICANDTPDHTVLARFRQDHEKALGDLLTDSLKLAAELGFVRFGVVALDGTKIAANASREANRTEAGLRKIAERHLAETAATDAAEDTLFGPDARGDELPDKLRDRTHRGRRIGQALELIGTRKAEQVKASQADAAAAQAYRAKAAQVSGSAPMGRPPKGMDRVEAARLRAERERARAQAHVDAWQAKADTAAATGHKMPGKPPTPVDDRPAVRAARADYDQARADADQNQGGNPLENNDDSNTSTEPTTKPIANLTDPDSRLMSTRNGWEQGYNGQTAVSEDQFILRGELTQDHTDYGQFIPTVDAVTSTAAELADHTGRDDLAIGTVIADAGYDTNDNLDADGPDRLIANGRRHKLNKRAQHDPATGDPPPDATTRQAIDHRLRTPDGHQLYSRRSPLVEGPNGWLKDQRGLRRFSRRSLPAAHSEFNFACTVTNLLRLRNLGATTAQLATR